MTALTISVDDEYLQKLEQTAHRLGVKVEELVRLSVGEYVARRRGFEEAADYVLRKNAELYRRLAQ